MVDERNRIEFVVGNKKFYGQEIRKKGKIEIERFHNELIPWFQENKYDFTEKDLTGKDTSEGRDEKFEWVAQRKVDSYFKFYINVHCIIMRLKGDQGQIVLRFKGYLEKDYKEQFKRKYGKFGEFLRRLYERYIIPDKVDKMAGKVYSETNDLIDKAKGILNLTVK